MQRQLVLVACVGLALCGPAPAGSAAERGISQPAGQAASGYPARPVRFIVPFPPSGGTDIVARLLGRQLGERLGQQFVIDNRPGAASTIGANIAAKAAPDGYTLILVTASYAISASYYKALPYDSVNDFDAVARVAAGPLLVVVHPSIAASSMKELIALAKSAPSKMNYASGGAGGINHLAGEMLKTMTGTRILHVPYKGAGPALTALVAGEAQLMIATLGSALPHVRSGRLKALAAAGERRSTLLPELPTVAESGVPGYAADNWYGLLAPRKTPPAILGLLSKHVSAILNTDDVRERLTSLGFESAPSTPAQFSGYLRAEIRKWSRVMKEAGIRPE